MRGLIFAAALGAVVSQAADKPNFSGKWIADVELSSQSGGGRGDFAGRASGGGGGRGGGTGLGAPPEAMTIKQDERSLEVVEQVDGKMFTLVYQFDGKPVKNTMRVGRGAAVDALFRTTWKDSTIETNIVRREIIRGALREAEYRERRSLDRQGRMGG